jgi:paxillin
MDELNLLLDDLTKANPRADTKPKPTNVDLQELESLMDDLTAKPELKKSNGPATPPPKNQATIDDLDALMNDLSTKPKQPVAAAPKKMVTSSIVVQHKQPSKPAQPNSVDDLEALMSDLTKPNQPAPAPKNPSNNHVDELEALMSDLSGQARPAQPKPVPGRVVTSSIVVQPKQPAKSDPVNDLDALMNDLTNGSGASKAAPAPAKKKPDAVDELDALMVGLSTGSSGGGPTSVTSASRHDDELDSLMAGLSNNTRGPATTPYRSAATPNTGYAANNTASYANTTPAYNPANNAARRRDDLDDLLTNLNTEMHELQPGVTPQANNLSRGICATCRKPIFGEMMTALGRTYHQEHFACGACGNPIGTGNFFEQEGQPHCERCFSARFCPKCAHCNAPVVDRCLNALGKTWHVNCFVCTQCLSSFSGGNFYERDKRPYCEKCFFEVFAPRCRACNQAVRGDCVNALGSQWHPEHFNCQTCHKSFGGGTFYEFQGMPYCDVHYYMQTGSTCGGCSQAITGPSVSALGKKWHPEHFSCAFCTNLLSGSAYTEQNGKPYCKNCHKKLFSA